MIFRKLLLITISSNYCTNYSTEQYCQAEFIFKFFDEMRKKIETRDRVGESAYHSVMPEGEKHWGCQK